MLRWVAKTVAPFVVAGRDKYTPELVEQIRSNTFPHTELDLRVRSYLSHINDWNINQHSLIFAID